MGTPRCVCSENVSVTGGCFVAQNALLCFCSGQRIQFASGWIWSATHRSENRTGAPRFHIRTDASPYGFGDMIVRHHSGPEAHWADSLSDEESSRFQAVRGGMGTACNCDFVACVPQQVGGIHSADCRADRRSGRSVCCYEAVLALIRLSQGASIPSSLVNATCLLVPPRNDGCLQSSRAAARADTLLEIVCPCLVRWWKGNTFCSVRDDRLNDCLECTCDVSCPNRSAFHHG